MPPLKFKTSIIWDLDGVLFKFRDVSKEAYAKKDYDAVVRFQLVAPPIPQMVMVARAFALDNNSIIFTARSEEYRNETIEQIKAANIPQDAVFMRPYGNEDTSPVLKMKMYAQFLGDFKPIAKASLIIEDRKDVANAFNMNGIPALLYRQEFFK